MSLTKRWEILHLSCHIISRNIYDVNFSMNIDHWWTLRLDELWLELAVHLRSGLVQPVDVVGVGGDDETEVGVGFPVEKLHSLPTDDDVRRPSSKSLSCHYSVCVYVKVTGWYEDWDFTAIIGLNTRFNERTGECRVWVTHRNWAISWSLFLFVIFLGLIMNR